MTIMPKLLWPFAEHIELGKYFDGSIGSDVLFCISTSCQGPWIFSIPTILSVTEVLPDYKLSIRLLPVRCAHFCDMVTSPEATGEQEGEPVGV